ncbi:hypothetical protein FB45DRAFT_858785 [Roridomyces roridus]|uniref:Uncharacterized protein n=1 Tax=Roridomyces roridus TaxID=1738132 RepID=A0AAD7CKG2_9AGAR|nr:hypothetical protein FB45DRAFT_858785 [Roridomyces roridus]
MATVSPAAAAAQEAALLQLITDSQTTNYLAGEPANVSNVPWTLTRSEAAGLTLLIRMGPTVNCSVEHVSTFKEEVGAFRGSTRRADDDIQVQYVWQSRLSLWSVLYVWDYNGMKDRFFEADSLFHTCCIGSCSDLRSPPKSVVFSLFCCKIFIGVTPFVVLDSEMATSTAIIISVDFILVLRFAVEMATMCVYAYLKLPGKTDRVDFRTTFGLLTILPLKAETDFIAVGQVHNFNLAHPLITDTIPTDQF